MPVGDSLKDAVRFIFCKGHMTVLQRTDLSGRGKIQENQLRDYFAQLMREMSVA